MAAWATCGQRTGPGSGRSARTRRNLPAATAGRKGTPRPAGRHQGTGTIEARPQTPSKEIPLSAPDPNYNPETDTYRQIYRGHENASAVTNSEGVTVYFDPDTHDVLGFSIAQFSAYYKAHATPEGEFEVTLPAKVPANLEEEMDFDVEALTSGVRIAEFY